MRILIQLSPAEWKALEEDARKHHRSDPRDQAAWIVSRWLGVAPVEDDDDQDNDQAA